MSRLDTFIRFPLAAAMLAAMTTVTGCHTLPGRDGADRGQEVALGDLPKPAQDSIRKEAGEAPITSITAKGTIPGAHTYTVDTVKEGRQMNIQVTETGAVAWVQTEVGVEDLPTLVKRTADAETLGYPNRSFAKKVLHGKTTYIACAATAMRGKVIEIDENGRIIHRELKSA
jgi:hypothetical protein